MKPFSLFAVWWGLLTVMIPLPLRAAPLEALRQQADQSIKDGNWNDALKVLREILVLPGHGGQPLAEDLGKAVQCVQNLNRLELWDGVVEETVQAHPQDWKLLSGAAGLYQNAQPWGTIVSGEFRRGQHEGGKPVSSAARDRVRSLQLWEQAMLLVPDRGESPEEKAGFYQQFAGAVSRVAGWELQALTDGSLVMEGAAVTTGKHEVTLRRTGTGPVYANVYLSNFTLEDRISRAGLEVKVDRAYYKLVGRKDATALVSGARGQASGQKVLKYDRVPLKDGAVLKSGELVEVELTLEGKNDYEYLLIEDMKPAGFEPDDVRSGYTWEGLGAYREFRDNRVVFFVRALPLGKHNLSYRLRAEIPGKFSALPAIGNGMYAPELRANSDGMKLGVED